jgi:hypothetical protein
MIVTKKRLSRRTLLRGAGAAIGLPLLDAMRPALAGPALPKAPVRLSFVYIPNGVTAREWFPSSTGADFAYSRILKPLEPFRKDILVLSGLDHHIANALGDGGGDHARAGACYLTGVHPKKTQGSDIQAGISVDQIAAKALGSATRLGSLELGCEDSRTVGGCDSGYSCAYTNSISWRGPQTPMPPETNPRIVFERLFGDDDFAAPPEARARRAAQRKSILDLVNQRTKQLMGDLGAADRRKIDEYLTAVRELEVRIGRAEKDQTGFRPSIGKPSGVPVAFADYLKLMYDLQVLAFQADATRVTTLMYGREASVRTYPEIGVADAHHPLSHHRSLPENVEKITQINVHHTTLFAYFLEKLRATRDGEGSLLDHSLVVYGSAILDGNSHSHENLPVLLAGRGDGSIQPGRHIRYAEGTPMTNLYLTLLDRMNINTEKLGDSTGRLEHLTDL